MTTILGIILAAATLTIYIKYQPRVRTACCKTLMVAGAMSIVSMAIPVTGVLFWVALALQAVVFGCVLVSARDYRLTQRGRRHHLECRQLREKMKL